MIQISVYADSIEEEVKEAKELIFGDGTKSIYDDVATLQEQMQEVFNIIDSLNNDFIPEHTVNLNDADLNEQIGKIIIGYGNNCANKPTTQNGYLINIPHNSAPERFGKQIWITRPSNNIFVRNLDDGNFSEWATVYYDSGWKDLTLSAGVSQQNAEQYPCRCRRLGNVVYVEGAITGFSDVTKVVATLPDGYRPDKSFYMQNVTNAGKTDTFRVYTNGVIERIATTKTPLATNDYHFINTSFLIN